MGDEKHVYEPYENAPIPTYEEATSSRHHQQHHRHTSQSRNEASNDAERQGLLSAPDGLATSVSGSGVSRRNGYQAPSVQSVRSSMDTDEALGLIESETEEEATTAVRREMAEMEIMDDVEAAQDEDSRARRRRQRLGASLQKRLYSLTNTLSSFHLPTIRVPSFRFLTDRLPTVPDEYKPNWMIVARLAGLFLVISLIFALFTTDLLPGSRSGFGAPVHPEWARQFVQANLDSQRIEDDLRHITSFDHVAGTIGNEYLGKQIEARFVGAGMDSVDRHFFYPYLNYPKPDGRRVAIVSPPELAWEAELEEKSAYENPKPEQRQQTLTFHGLSKAGNVTGRLVYANYGTREDFKKFADSAIDLHGSIALVRYGGNPADRAMKVKTAENAGAVGCLIYSDPTDSGFVKGEVYPNGRWLPEDGVERGSVALTSWVMGDVLTPGYASDEHADRVSKENNPGLVNIPSLPISWKNAQKLLQALKGHGERVPEEWVGGVPEVSEWWTGNNKDTSPLIHLKNEQDEVEKTKIFNVMGSILGVESTAKKIIVGNHRDSWCFGSGDSGSGTAVMLEVVRVLGLLRTQGWRPLRSIYFASWDAEEYNLIGSTEFVEQNIADMRENAMAYLNVDVGVVGDKLRAAGSPVFRNAFMRVLDRVMDPVRNKTMRDVWDDNQSQLGGLGAESDYAAFQNFAGCSSLDFGFDGPGFPSHSCYETFEWMNQFGDPGMKYHRVLAEIWVLLILELSQEPILPFDFNTYPAAMRDWAEELDGYADTRGAPRHKTAEGVQFDTTPLWTAVSLFKDSAKEFVKWEDQWYNHVISTGGMESNLLESARTDHNRRAADFDMNLLDLPADGKGDERTYGTPGREQYKHVVFGPQAWSSYDVGYFPAIRDAIDARNWTAAQQQVNKAAEILTRACARLLQ